MAELFESERIRLQKMYGHMPDVFSHIGEKQYFGMRRRLRIMPGLKDIIKRKDPKAHSVLLKVLEINEPELTAKGTAHRIGIDEQSMKAALKRAHALVMGLRLPRITPNQPEKARRKGEPKKMPAKPIRHSKYREIDELMRKRLESDENLHGELEKLGPAGSAYLLHIGFGGGKRMDYLEIARKLNVGRQSARTLTEMARNWIRRH